MSREELKNEMRELKMNLIIAKITREDLPQLFENCEVNDMISIFELSRLLKRKPLLHRGDTIKISRYLIENKEHKEIEYNEMAEERIGVILDHIASFAGNYTIYSGEEEKEIKASIMQVISF